MSGIGVLTVPLPTLDYKLVAGSYAALESALTVRLGAVLFPDGKSITPNDVRKAFALIFRWSGPAATAELWNAKAKAWQSPGSVELYDVAGVPFAANETTPTGWEGLVIPLGGKDTWGNPQFVPAVANYPQYRVRAAFTAQVDADEFKGLSGESASFEFMSTVENARFGVALTPSSAIDATNVSLLLKNSAQQIIVFIEMDAGGSLTLGNVSASGSPLATVMLQASGDITLTPATGQRVVIAGDLDVAHVSYLPSGGGPKKNLA